VSATDIANAGLGKPEKSHLPLFDEITDGAGDVLDRHAKINAMLIGQIDMVGAKPALTPRSLAVSQRGPSVTT
jgi:hypothetical protein